MSEIPAIDLSVVQMHEISVATQQFLVIPVQTQTLPRSSSSFSELLLDLLDLRLVPETEECHTSLYYLAPFLSTRGRRGSFVLTFVVLHLLS